MIKSLLTALLFLFVAVPATAEVRGAVQKIIPPAPLTTPAVQLDGAIGVCRIVIPGSVTKPEASYYNLNPIAFAGSLADDNRSDLDLKRIIEGVGTAKVSVLQSPNHGIIVNTGDLIDYHPNSDYRGEDTATVLVEIGGYKIKVVYYIHVGGEGAGETSAQEYCPNPVDDKSSWPISIDGVKNNPFSINIAPLASGTLASTQGTTIP